VLLQAKDHPRHVVHVRLLHFVAAPGGAAQEEVSRR
jgi:hypothetical protein